MHISSLSMQSHIDSRGVLRIFNMCDLPFECVRTFCISGVPSGSIHGGHAHKQTHQALFAVCGSVDVVIENAHSPNVFKKTLFAGAQGLYVPPMSWLVLRDFSMDAVCVVFCSTFYDEADYIYDYTKFKRARTIL